MSWHMFWTMARLVDVLEALECAGFFKYCQRVAEDIDALFAFSKCSQMPETDALSSPTIVVNRHRGEKEPHGYEQSYFAARIFSPVMKF